MRASWFQGSREGERETDRERDTERERKRETEVQEVRTAYKHDAPFLVSRW